MEIFAKNKNCFSSFFDKKAKMEQEFTLSEISCSLLKRGRERERERERGKERDSMTVKGHLIRKETDLLSTHKICIHFLACSCLILPKRNNNNNFRSLENL
jgi:hypothetical protein